MEQSPQYSTARLARLQGYLEQDPQNFSLLTDAFDCALMLGELDTAQQYLTRALEIEPHNVFLRHSQATLWIAETHYAEAESLLGALIAEGVNSAVVAFNLAYAQFRQSKYAEARDLLRSLLGAPDTPPDCFAMLLRCLHHLRESAEAFALIETRLREKTLDATAAGVASLLYLDENKLGEAKFLAEAALQNYPNHVEALVTRASIALGERDVTTARPLLARALEQNAQDGRVWSASAMTHLLEMNIDQALSEFKTAISFMPNHIGTWHGMAWCNLMKNDFVAARQNFETAMALDHNFGETHGGLAVVLALQGQREEAKQSIERALRLDPQGLSARYAEAVLSGVVADREAFQRLARRVLGARAHGSGTLADLIPELGQQTDKS